MNPGEPATKSFLFLSSDSLGLCQVAERRLSLDLALRRSAFRGCLVKRQRRLARIWNVGSFVRRLLLGRHCPKPYAERTTLTSPELPASNSKVEEMPGNFKLPSYTVYFDTNTAYSRKPSECVSPKIIKSIESARKVTKVDLRVPEVVFEELIYQQFKIACSAVENLQKNSETLRVVCGSAVVRV